MNEQIKSDFHSFSYISPVPVRGKWMTETIISVITFFRHDQIIYTHTLHALKGLHSLSIEEKTKAVLQFFNKHPLTLFTLSFDQLTVLPTINSAKENLHQEVLFAIESIIIGFKHSQKKDYRPKKVQFNFLLQNFTMNLTSSVKIKINSDIILDSTYLFELFQFLADPKITYIRFDANCSLTIDELESFVKLIPPEIFSKIDYFEDPSRDWNSALDLLSQLNLAMGLDEIPLTPQMINLPKRTRLVAIIKPSLIGVKKSAEMIKEFSQHNIETVISSTFELPSDYFTLVQLADLSNSVSNKSIFHGLDTLKFLPSSAHTFSILDNEVSL